MTNSTSEQTITEFFDIYAHALEQYDSKKLVMIHFLPCTMISDDAYTVFSDASKLEGFFNQGLFFYRQFGIARIQADVWSNVHLTAGVKRVKTNWKFFDKAGKALYNCDYHYIMKLDKGNIWRIALTVAVNERERIEAWRNSLDN